MTFTATHRQGFAGQDITVSVLAGENQHIASISVQLDGEDLEDTELAPGSDSYTQTFKQVGQSFPGSEHSLVVTAMDADDEPHSATTRWTD